MADEGLGGRSDVLGVGDVGWHVGSWGWAGREIV